ncbi:MAG: asparagine synthase (glutamine-hydrolyzing) [Chitinophagaceae bacterium]|nr:asparagine synthase (glutamine-hydrolyzing) [Chitinophagaceae bacterium]
MCGIAGIISVNKNEITTTRLKAMTDVIAHRGPDGEGQWINPDGRTGLGNRRLSIIDLSEAGRQPMHYMDRYTITFNGEIYNYVELKEMCLKKGYVFTSQTDTEVLMAMYDWKKEECLQYLDGMFAFALHDEAERKVFMARDRFGEKPFYYISQPGQLFAFASEMKALWAAGFKREVNKRMLYNYMAFNYTQNAEDPAETFFEDIRSLPAAHHISIDTETLAYDSKKYWDIDHDRIDTAISIEAAKEKFKELFYTSVTRRLRCDVKVGSSLSGGIDSSIVVAVIDDLNKEKKIKQSTFSAIFPGYVKDESSYIDLLLDKLKLEPHFTSPSGETLLKNIDECFYYQEEPFGSASVLTQYEVMKLAKRSGVTVLLDGQGADELLAGYHSFYTIFFKELKATNKDSYQEEKEAYKKKFKDSAINPLPEKSIRYYAGQLGWIEKDKLKKIYEKFTQLVNPYFNNDFFDEYRKEQFNSPASPDTLNRSLYNSLHFGLGELLRFADRNSMAHSREIRLPFLFHELAEFLFTLPSSFKIHDGWTKYIERVSFENLLPSFIAWRKDKIGYEPPQKDWMQQNDIKDKVMAVRELLVKEKILHRSVLNDPVTANDANIGTKNSWSHLMLSCLFK